MRHVTTETDGVLRPRGAEPAAFLADGAGDAEKHLSIRHLRQLRLDHAWREERAERVPSRTGTREPWNEEPRRTEPLGHVAGDIDPQHMERNTLGAGPPQRRQAVARLLEARLEPMPE